MKTSVQTNLNSQFSKLKEAGYETTKHVHKSGDLHTNILNDLNSGDEKRGIKVIVKGQTTDQYLKALTAILKQDNWDVAFLSDIDGKPEDALGLVLNRGVRIKTLNPKKLIKDGYNVIRVQPPVVIPDSNGENETIITAPKVQPILVFIGVFILVIIAAWAIWRVSS